VKQAAGGLRAVLRATRNARSGRPGTTTPASWPARPTCSTPGARALAARRQQRIAWGSGFAWNPSNRLEAAQEPAQPGAGAEGARAARMDWQPVPWAGVISRRRRATPACATCPSTRRSRSAAPGPCGALLVKDTDLAWSPRGEERALALRPGPGRELGGLTLHAEAALQRGSEIAPPRDDETFLRVAAGALRASGETTLSLEYFYNGEGYSDAAMDAYLRALDVAWRPRRIRACRPRRSRPRSRATWRRRPSPSPRDGLRRHYLQAAVTRGAAGGAWSWSARGVVGFRTAGSR